MGLSILLFKGSKREVSELLCIMLHFMCVFTVCESTCSGVSRIQRVNIPNIIYLLRMNKTNTKAGTYSHLVLRVVTP